jgi:hypothetical protein
MNLNTISFALVGKANKTTKQPSKVIELFCVCAKLEDLCHWTNAITSLDEPCVSWICLGSWNWNQIRLFYWAPGLTKFHIIIN